MGWQERLWIPLDTTNWERAAKLRREIEIAEGIAEHAETDSGPTFGAVVEAFLGTDARAAGVKPSMRAKYRSVLRATGAVMAFFAHRPAETITPAQIDAFWQERIGDGARSVQTGVHDVNVLAAVFRFAQRRRMLGFEEDGTPRGNDAVERFRDIYLRDYKKRGPKAAHEPHPIRDASALARLVEAALTATVDKPSKNPVTGAPRDAALMGGPDWHTRVAFLLMLDAGLRIGEVQALRWGDVHFADDRRRCITVRRTLSVGVEGTTKGGRTKEVPLSKRLQALLREWRLVAGRPSAEQRVLPYFHGTLVDNWRARRWQRLLNEADHAGELLKAKPGRNGELVPLTPHDLRDTGASWLLSLGVPVATVSRMYLGHASVAVTEKHYATFIAQARFAYPRLKEDEVETDLLASIGGQGADRVRDSVETRGPDAIDR
jgi:integrase